MNQRSREGTRENAYHRRMEITKILLSGRRVTVGQLMKMFLVGRRAIEKDIAVIGQDYPIVSSRGYKGGFHMMDGPTKYHYALSEEQLICLHSLMELCDEEQRRIVISIIYEFGPYIEPD